ncbi:hypothetical protein FRB93_014069 [Tulasnella sp. JGI-2019a]|nr:hypothetical protein FRB93_014069 [Tulasnella sp. JGI-2019a]
MDSVRQLFQPAFLTQRYKELAPFFLDLLDTFANPPKTYCQQKARNQVHKAVHEPELSMMENEDREEELVESEDDDEAMDEEDND